MILDIIKVLSYVLKEHGLIALLTVVVLAFAVYLVNYLFKVQGVEISFKKKKKPINLTENPKDQSGKVPVYKDKNSGIVVIKKTKIALEDHQIFIDFDNMLHELETRGLPIYCPGRKLIFTDFLKFKVEDFNEALSEYIAENNDNTLNSKSALEFHHEMLWLINETIRKYESRCLMAGIPKVVISKFGEWHKETVEDTLKFLDILGQYDASNNYDKAYMLLSYLAVVFQRTLIDARRTLGSLNGDLDGVDYRGVKCIVLHPKD